MNLVSAHASSPADSAVDQLSWLAGHWLGETGSAQIEELWLSPSGGSMLGVNRTVVEGRRVGFEFLRIESDEHGVVYLASPAGRHPPTPFRLIEFGAQRAVFSNPDHDFPQRVIYRREGDTLHGRIEGVENGESKSAAWQWRLAR